MLINKHKVQWETHREGHMVPVVYEKSYMLWILPKWEEVWTGHLISTADHAKLDDYSNKDALEQTYAQYKSCTLVMDLIY